MSNKDQTRTQLIDEVARLRQRIAVLETSEVKRNKAEESLRKSEEEFRNLMLTIPECVYSALPDGEILYMAPSVTAIFGYSAEDFKKGKDLWIRLIHKDDKKGLLVKLEKLLKNGVPYIHEFRMKRKDGKVIWIRDHANAILAEKGKPVKITGIIYDISERKRAEEELQESEEKYRLITENTSDFISTTTFSLNPIYTYVSPSHNTFGYHPVDLLGKQCLDFIHPDDKTKLLPLIRRYINEDAEKRLNSKDADRFEKIEYRFKDKSGNWRHIETTANLIKDRLLLFVSKDITERRKAEEALCKKTYDLGERFKELNCLYDISKCVEDPDISLEDVLQGIVDLIPTAWQYPDRTCACLLLGGQKFKTKNFKETRWRQAADIRVYGKRIGELEIYFINKIPENEQHLLINDKKNLLKAISERLGKIIERKEAEKALKESEEKYRTSFENSRDAINIFSQNRKFLDVNRKLVQLSGYSKKRLLSMKLEDLYPEVVNPATKERIETMLQGKELPVFETYLLTKKGKKIPVEAGVTALRDCFAQKIVFQSNIRDITERKRAEEHIHSLTQQLIKAQENERQRISRDLHDHLAQDLSTLKISLDTIFDDKPDTPPEVKKRITKISQMIHTNIMDVRELAYGLRPADLDQLGLVRTVEQYCEDFSERNGLEINFISAGMDDLRLDSDTEINLYRLIQEALNNTKKHADASHVTIRLVASFPEIILRIEDDGKGFDVQERLIKARTEKRMGIQSMEERVSLLNGTMRIQSRSMEGTQISIKIHYKEKKNGSKKEHIDR